MPTVPEARTGSVVGVDEEFMELVCADEQLLRRQFDAIIAREWPTRRPPAGPGALSRGTGPGPGRRPRLGGRAGRALPGSRRPAGLRQRRQRSPPPTAVPQVTIDEGR